MKLTLLSPPAVPVVSEAVVWEHLKLILESGVPADRDYVRALIDAAGGELDGAQGLLSRALITQTWQLELDSFPSVIEIPLPPCQAVLAIAYAGPDGASPDFIGLAPPEYRVTGLGGACKAEISPAARKSWPNVAGSSGRVIVTFRAGYGDNPEDVPAPIRAAVLEIIATRYAYRESVSAGSGFSVLPESACAPLERYRVRGF